MKNKKLVFVLAAAMLLAGCGKGGNSSAPDSSAPAPESSQQAPASSEAPAPTSSEAPAPTSSSAAQPSSSSQAPVSSSSSEAPAPTMTKAAAELIVEGGKAYAVVKGTAANYPAGTFKFAWGFEHVTKVDKGEGFAYGSAEPADADYKESVTIAADGSYEAKFCLTDAGIESGLYKVYAGAKGFYGTIAAADATIAENRVTTDDFAYNYRKDDECDLMAAIAIDSLPPVTLTDVDLYEEGGQMWVKIGGALKDKYKDLTAADPSWTPFVNFQQVGGRWTNTRVTGDNVKWDFSEAGKAYICANVNFFAANNNYNTHINFKADKQQDCKMDVDINKTVVVGTKQVQIYSNTKASTSDQNEFWGNLGFRVTNAPAASISAKANADVSNVKFARVAWNDTTWSYDPIETPSSTLKVVNPSEAGQLVMVTWESTKKVTGVTVNGEPVDTLGDHKAFFTITEAINYSVEFAVADSLVTWSEDFPEMDWAYIDVEIRSANDDGDIYMAEGGETSIGWDYTEGDMMVITPMLEAGYVVTSLKVNGVELPAQQLPTFMGYMTAYVYNIPAAGEYTITCEYEYQVHYTATAVENENVSNVKFAIAEWSDEIFNFAPVGEPTETLDAVNAAGKTVMITWESTKKVTSVKVNGEETSVGNGKAFFTIQEDVTEYSVEFAVADTSIAWDETIEGIFMMDASIYNNDKYDVIYAESDPIIEWAYTEGDYVMIAPMTEPGYEIASVKVNGEDCQKVEQSNPWGGTETFYVYYIDEAGDYKITVETKPESPFEEGGEAGSEDGTIENW